MPDVPRRASTRNTTLGAPASAHRTHFDSTHALRLRPLVSSSLRDVTKRLAQMGPPLSSQDPPCADRSALLSASEPEPAQRIDLSHALGLARHPPTLDNARIARRASPSHQLPSSYSRRGTRHRRVTTSPLLCASQRPTLPWLEPGGPIVQTLLSKRTHPEATGTSLDTPRAPLGRHDLGCTLAVPARRRPPSPHALAGRASA